MGARLTLTREDNRVYLNRWGFQWKRLGGIFLHHMTAPDPGYDLHNHPWWFLSIVLRGGYYEQYGETSPSTLWTAAKIWRPLSIHFFPMKGRHRVIGLRNNKSSWSLIIHGPHRREWGFFVDGFWQRARDYEGTARGKARGLQWKSSTNPTNGLDAEQHQ